MLNKPRGLGQQWRILKLDKESILPILKLLNQIDMQEKVLVDKQFVLEAHKAACDTWKAKIAEKFPEIFNILNKIMATEEYKRYMGCAIDETNLLQEKNEIFIRLPISNSLWTFAAWDLAKYICDEFDYYPDCTSFPQKDRRETLWITLKKKDS